MMKQERKSVGNRKGGWYILFSLIPFLGYSCVNDDNGTTCDGTQAVIALSVRAASDINQDQRFWEDRVTELRMLAFDSETGLVAFNEKLYFPNGFNVQSRAILFTPGVYNFYFIANETVYSGNFVSALMAIQEETEFTTDSRFTTLAYNPDFLPDGTTQSGRFVMSAVYKNITVISGGTENNPVLLALPTEKVELVRSLAKVEVVFRKSVSGSTVPENTITSVLLENVAATFSVPPVDTYYNGATTSTHTSSLTGLDYGRDSIGSVIFYIPEFLVQEGSTEATLLEINNQTYPIENDDELEGLQEQRRTIPALSTNSVIRNYHYIVNAYIDGEGGVQLRTYVRPWQKDQYRYIFEGDRQIVLPPIIPTDSSVIIPTECGTVEIMSHNEDLTQGLMGAYNDEIIYWDPETQGPTIKKGDPPYYCEKKYGEGWRLINSCELLSFLAVLDTTYTIWLSNTWEAETYGKPYYPLYFRQAAQELLEKLSGLDLSASVLYPVNNWQDELVDDKLDIVDRYFTPGDILVREMDFPNGWPYPTPPATGPSEDWIYNQVSIQVKAYWYGEGYLSPAVRSSWDTILYSQFERFDYSSTVSRCVRTVD